MSNALANNLLLITLGAAMLPISGCDTEGPLVLRTSNKTVKAYEELTKEWIRWALETPHGQSPIADTTGDFCHVGQDGVVWMLAGSYGGPVQRECTIPEHTPLFFPLVNRWCVPSNEWAEQPGNYEYYVDEWLPEWQADSRAHTCALTLRIDGVDLLADTAERDEELYVAITEPFSSEVDADNWWVAHGYEFPSGTYDYVTADGHWALFKPLPPGDHVLEFGGTVCDDEGGVAFETGATYLLHVGGSPEEDGEEQD